MTSQGQFAEKVVVVTGASSGIGRAAALGFSREGASVVLVSRDAIVDVFRHNLVYFFGGRHTGFAIYYFPGMAALLLFLALRGQQTNWGWLTLAGGVGSAHGECDQERMQSAVVKRLV